jgi:RNA polymerase sigma-70 factor (ECF subfamily)
MLAESNTIRYPESLAITGFAKIAVNIDSLFEIAVRFLAQMKEQKPNITFASVDLEDIRQSRNGDGDAYRRLVERHQGHVASIMWRFSRDKNIHEELVQDVFVEAYMSLPTYSGTAPFAHWLSRVAVRAGYRFWKQKTKEKSRNIVELQQWDDIADNNTDALAAEDAAEIVNELLEKLPPRDRLILTLRYLENKSEEQTVELTGWSKAMVKVQGFRARKKMKKLLAERLGRTK